MANLVRTLWCVLALALLSPGFARASAPDDGILYVMPVWLQFFNLSDSQFAAEVQKLRTRFPADGPVRTGFSVYLDISMEKWEVTTEAEALANLTFTINRIDRAIARARANDLRIAFLFSTAIRSAVDPAQASSQTEDRRVMQWYSDNTLATGWWTYSRYARRQHAVRELYIRALARVVANRMARYPETLVAAAGDAEIELAFKNHGPPYADYSPFAIAEFRDWLRGEGLYGPGQPYAAEAYQHAARYRGDATPAIDSNGDVQTLNSIFGTSFTSWDLRYFPWSLSDRLYPDPDPNAISEATYAAPGWNRFPDSGAGRFDAPRDQSSAPAAWWQVWFSFREHLVWRYQQDFARWMTTSADPATGTTVTAPRWFSYQIPADYLYGHTPAAPDFRYLTSASAWWTSDIRPHGGAGITAFNTQVAPGVWARTLPQVAPLVASLNTRWAIFEWNPSVPPTADPTIYRDEIAIIEARRPYLVAPYAWDAHPVLDTGFETALNEMIGRMRHAPWALRTTVNGGAVRVTWAPPESGAAPDSYVLEVGSQPTRSNIVTMETGSRSVVLDAVGPPGAYYLRVRARRGGVLSSASNEVRLVITAPGAAPGAPTGLVEVTSANRVTFNWLAPAAAPEPTGYVIEAGTAPGLANLATLRTGPTTTAVVGGVPPGVYHVQVRADHGGALSAPSNSVAVAAPGPNNVCTPVQPPAAPAFRLAGTTITFEWDAAHSGAAPVAYQLEAGTAAGLSDIAVVTLGTARRFTVTAPAGTYFIRMRAVGACGTSVPGPTIRLVVP